MRRIRFAGPLFLLLIVVTVTTDPGRAAPVADAWLEGAEPEPWNVPGPDVPLPTPPETPIDPRFSARARVPEAMEESTLVDSGWQLFGASQSGWGVRIIQATSFYDGMGRPWQYQVFVFVDGGFAGTLSPHPMNSRFDGALDQTTLTGENTIRATFRRVAANDPLCCPSSSATVDYRIDRTDDGAAVVPTRITRAPSGAPLLGEATLKNAGYEVPGLGLISLSDGAYERRSGEGATQVTRVTYLLSANGHLDGDGLEDATVVLAVNTGGSGTFVYLMAMHNQNGTAQHVGARFLGDRVRVQSMSIESGEITALLRTFGPTDPLCCPTLDVTRRYRVETVLAELP